MHIRLDRVRHVVIDHVGDAFHVNPAPGDVGGDQHAVAAGAEALQRGHALVLGAIAVDLGRRDAGFGQLAGEPFGAPLGAGEHERRILHRSRPATPRAAAS